MTHLASSSSAEAREARLTFPSTLRRSGESSYSDLCASHAIFFIWGHWHVWEFNCLPSTLFGHGTHSCFLEGIWLEFLILKRNYGYLTVFNKFKIIPLQVSSSLANLEKDLSAPFMHCTLCQATASWNGFPILSMPKRVARHQVVITSLKLIPTCGEGWFIPR